MLPDNIPPLDNVPYKQHIAKVTRTFLGWEDHGILTAVLHLDYGGSAQGAGTYCLDRHSDEEREGTAFGLEWIMRAMQACGVREWDHIKGRTIYAYSEHMKVHGIGPLPTEPGRLFMFDELAKKYREALDA